MSPINAAAAGGGHWDCIKYVQDEVFNQWGEKTYEDNYSTCVEAARNGHVEILKKLKENGYEWNEFTCLLLLVVDIWIV